MVRKAYILWKKEENKSWSILDMYTNEELDEVVKDWNLTHNSTQGTKKGLMELKVNIYKEHNNWDCKWTCAPVMDPNEEEENGN